MLISIAMASCGELALICAVIVYFILVSIDANAKLFASKLKITLNELFPFHFEFTVS